MPKLDIFDFPEGPRKGCRIRVSYSCRDDVLTYGFARHMQKQEPIVYSVFLAEGELARPHTPGPPCALKLPEVEANDRPRCEARG